MLEDLWQRRIVVLGASGWLGTTLVRELLSQGSRDHLLVASHTRQQLLGSNNYLVRAFSKPEIRDFSPEVVINCAFLTKDRFKTHDIQDFIRINEELTSQFLDVLSLPQVGVGVTISSGSATLQSADSIKLNPYGYLKRLEQEKLLSMGSSTLTVGVARAWSLSGDLVPSPTSYALSNFIWQALTTGEISVDAPNEVWRRYCDAAEFLNVALLSIMSGRASIVDSGGPLVELRALAETVADTIGNVTVTSSSPVGTPEIYASNGQQYQQLCTELGISVESLVSQINRVVSAIRSRISSENEI
jgi:nucleoside-diphosphate-sugar epimerase